MKLFLLKFDVWPHITAVLIGHLFVSDKLSCVVKAPNSNKLALEIYAYTGK
jgi:hypothetical protein